MMPASCRARQRLAASSPTRSEEHTYELQSLTKLVCRLLLEKKEEHHAVQRLGRCPRETAGRPRGGGELCPRSVLRQISCGSAEVGDVWLFFKAGGPTEICAVSRRVILPI